MITIADVKNNEKIKTYIQKADETLGVLGYTDHGLFHSTKVANESKEILETMGYPKREAELAWISGYLHDIGNVVNRTAHAQSGAILAFRLLEDMGSNPEDTATIITAIGNHDENTSRPVNPICAAVVLADKCDVRYSRVRNQDPTTFDIHDRVNFAVKQSSLTISEDKTTITLDMTIDTTQCAVMDYFEIFLSRMALCRKAADNLNLRFALVVNGQQLL
ncbi:MAG: HD domain-containing protein [Defluviitaleaceae bacterium]|nr:HD domain-containing protein [Defluviitaleaceae bacterium]